jgi:hypothetical protein
MDDDAIGDLFECGPRGRFSGCVFAFGKKIFASWAANGNQPVEAKLNACAETGGRHVAPQTPSR